MTAPGRFRLGCAVWAYPGWMGSLYPRGTRSADTLARYVERFETVEGNSMFHALPGPATVARWADTMPDTFRYVPKLPRDVTHAGLMAPTGAHVEAFLELIAPLGARVGAVFAQLPASYAPECLDDLAAFVGAWPADAPPLLVEVRHRRWYEQPVAHDLARVLVQAGVGRVVIDTRAIFQCDDDPQRDHPRPKPRLPLAAVATADTCMLRFIGHPDPGENERWLPDWAARLDRWLRQGRDVYAFAHCPQEEHSPFIARRLQELLEERGAPVGPLPWDELAEPPQQMGLF